MSIETYLHILIKCSCLSSSFNHPTLSPRYMFIECLLYELHVAPCQRTLNWSIKKLKLKLYCPSPCTRWPVLQIVIWYRETPTVFNDLIHIGHRFYPPMSCSYVTCFTPITSPHDFSVLCVHVFNLGHIYELLICLCVNELTVRKQQARNFHQWEWIKIKIYEWNPWIW